MCDSDTNTSCVFCKNYNYKVEACNYPIVPEASVFPIADYMAAESLGSCDSGNGCVSTETTDSDAVAEFKGYNTHDVLRTDFETYKILSKLGEGAFGIVHLAWGYARQKHVAIKIIKDADNSVREAAREVYFLKKIKESYGRYFHLLHYEDAFLCKDQYCLVFEFLQENLETFMKRRNYTPLSIKHIRPIISQLIIALIKLQQLQIIHTDIKPDNIMLINCEKVPYRIKLVDFGNAIHFHEAGWSTYIQSLYYRSPEVILGAPFDSSVDVWSVGCVAVHLYLGTQLYKGNTSYDQLRLIGETQGFPDTDLLNSGRKTRRFFREIGPSLWALKNPKEYRKQMHRKTGDRCLYKFTSLDQLVTFASYEVYLYNSLNMDIHDFVDLVKGLLAVNPKIRLTPQIALQHPFLTMSRIGRLWYNCVYVYDCYATLRNAQLMQ